MGLNTAGINAVLEDGNEAVLYVAIGDGPTSADETSTARVLVTDTVASGVITATGVPYAFTGTPAAGATHALFFSASAAGTFYGFDAITGDQVFNGEGQFNLTSFTITGSSPA
jgi:glucose dehydrogenase